MDFPYTIGTVELDRIAGFVASRGHDDRADSPFGDSLHEWAAARAISFDAISHLASCVAMICQQELEKEARGAPPLEPHSDLIREELVAAVAFGFQIGVDAERRRRDSVELPGV